MSLDNIQPYPGITRLKEEINKLQVELDKALRRADRAEHVLVESAVVPGVDYPCQCDYCKKVAQALDGQGFLSDVPQCDRWWSDDDPPDVDIGG